MDITQIFDEQDKNAVECMFSQHYEMHIAWKYPEYIKIHVLIHPDTNFIVRPPDKVVLDCMIAIS